MDNSNSNIELFMFALSVTCTVGASELLQLHTRYIMLEFLYTVVSGKYAPPFAMFALQQIARGLIRGMQHFLSRLHPPFRYPAHNGGAPPTTLCRRQRIWWLCSCYLEGFYLYMWQSRVEMEGYSNVYFDCIAMFEAPYRWTAVRVGLIHSL